MRKRNRLIHLMLLKVLQYQADVNQKSVSMNHVLILLLLQKQKSKSDMDSNEESDGEGQRFAEMQCMYKKRFDQ